jgi:hypothetical protein
MRNLQEAKRRAWAMREEWRERGEFREADFRAALYPVLADLGDGDLTTLVDVTADEVDRESLAITPKDQRTPSGFDLVGEYLLENGRRIAKGEATKAHMEEHLRLSDAAVRAQMQATLRKAAAFLVIEDYDPDSQMSRQEELLCDAMIEGIRESIPALYLLDETWRSRMPEYDIIMAEIRRRIGLLN